MTLDDDSHHNILVRGPGTWWGRNSWRGRTWPFRVLAESPPQWRRTESLGDCQGLDAAISVDPSQGEGPFVRHAERTPFEGGVAPATLELGEVGLGDAGRDLVQCA